MGYTHLSHEEIKIKDGEILVIDSRGVITRVKVGAGIRRGRCQEMCPAAGAHHHSTVTQQHGVRAKYPDFTVHPPSTLSGTT